VQIRPQFFSYRGHRHTQTNAGDYIFPRFRGDNKVEMLDHCMLNKSEVSPKTTQHQDQDENPQLKKNGSMLEDALLFAVAITRMKLLEQATHH